MLVRLAGIVCFLLFCLPGVAWADDQPPITSVMIVGGAPPDPAPTQAVTGSIVFDGLPASLLVGVSYDFAPYDFISYPGYELCFLRHGARTCLKPTMNGWLTLDVRKDDGSGGFQYFTLRKHGVVYARSIVRLVT